MTYEEEKRIKEDKKKKIAEMSDTEKLNYLIDLVGKDVEMFTSCSDTYGVDFTDDYNETQSKIEEFIEVVRSK